MSPADIRKSKKMQKKKEKQEKRERKRANRGFPVIPVVILLIILGSIIAVLALNLFGLRETYVMPYIREAPVVGQFFPVPTEAPVDEELARIAEMTPEELQRELDGLSYRIEELEEQLQAARDQKRLDDETIDYLEGFESLVEEYREVKENFDRMVAAGGGANAYIEFFEEISPENAERLFQEAQTVSRYSADIRNRAATFAEMDETAAAEALDVLLGSQQELCIAIFENMSVEDRAAIFDEMTPDRVARVMTLMAPQEPEPTPEPLQTAPPIGG
jgi:Mg/Co/Ni transporter MgtE